MKNTATRALLAASLTWLGAWPAGGQVKPDPETRFNLGLQHLRDGRIDMAIESFKQAIKEDPKNAYFQKGLGMAYLAKREPGKAVEAFKKALEINPYYADVHNDLGTALSLAGKPEEAKREFLTAFNDPTFPTPEVAARNLGQAYLDEKNYNDASSWFRTAVQRNKSYPDGHLGLADTLAAQQRFDEAALQLELANKELPDSYPVLFALAEAYFKAGRFAESRSSFEQLARRDPAGAYGRRALERLRDFPR